MESWASSPAVRNVMRSNRGRDTRPEMALRRALHAAGLRYRLNARPIPDSRMTVDVVFPRARVAVEVRGCFWHACPKHYRPSRRNADFWSAKIAGNVARDDAKRIALSAAGWTLVVVWEHDEVPEAVERVKAAIADSGRLKSTELQSTRLVTH
ncbi:very short patch repair endonuclease [Mycobacterium sp. 663a-19]|uniref:very short patch repair endonuclease n=1 Tax=Mycobacterium sp. 663a-19 TaxID=2986148 RepID=UPI002D1F76C0|nr:very short patch repair endonuclease [Mycobacterium sp. 663a-19]MEB3982519.1 very short patch repair endonuclease [Mycobacterium sp. 663a-19]